MKRIIRAGMTAVAAAVLVVVAICLLNAVPQPGIVEAAPGARPMYARSALTVEEVSTSGLTATYNAASTDGIKFLNPNGNVIVHVKNAYTDSTTVTIEVGPTYAGLEFEDPTVTCPASGECFIGPFRTFFNEPSDTNYMYLDFSVATSVTVAVIEVEDAP